MSMSKKYSHLRDVSLPKTELSKTEWEELEHGVSEILRMMELGVGNKEWACACGVSDRWVREWKNKMQPVQKEHLFKIAKKTLDAEKRAHEKLQYAREVAHKICNLYQLDEIKGEL